MKIILLAPVIGDSCNPSPCGPNTDCAIGIANNPICACRPGFYGDAQSSRGCGPECTTNSECQSTSACINQKCRDPCPGVCGINAVCKVVGHNPVCSCVDGYSGNPYQSCRVVVEANSQSPLRPPQILPLNPGECTACRPECVLNSDCSSSLACINQKCRDPCSGVCAQNAACKVNNHNPVCSCLQGYTGEPTRGCYAIAAVPTRKNSLLHNLSSAYLYRY